MESNTLDRGRDEAAIVQLLQGYERALNTSDTDAATAMYTPDGVFMPQNSPSSVGIAAVRSAYDAVFATIALSVTFEIVEVRAIGSNWAFARTNSLGTVTVHATGASGAEANQELFVFEKIQDAWKIARYCFSTTNPAK